MPGAGLCNATQARTFATTVCFNGKGGEKIGEIFVNMGFYTNLKSTKLYREYYFLMSKTVQNYVQNVKKSPKNR